MDNKIKELEERIAILEQAIIILCKGSYAAYFKRGSLDSNIRLIIEKSSTNENDVFDNGKDFYKIKAERKES
jgi:hypothetical protein